MKKNICFNPRMFSANVYNVAGVDTLVPLQNGRLVKEVNFDNAATTPPLNSVLKEITSFSPYYSSYHRGTGYKSQLSSALYEYSKEVILDFVGGDKQEDTVIYVKNTTEAINKLANMMRYMYKGSTIISTCMEHHSNDLPWRENFNIQYVEIDKNYRLDLQDLKNKLKYSKGNVKLVTVTGASNVTGYKNPVHEIAALAHKYGAKILVDGAQLIPHSKFSMLDHNDPKHIDFLAFSGHKMYAPYGTGVLIGPKCEFEKLPPDHKGGGIVDVVTHRKVTWDEPPHKDEAGSPNIIGAVALATAVRSLNSMNLDKVDNNEKLLKSYLMNALKEMKDITVYIDNDIENSVGIIPFNINGIHHEILSKILSYEFGIATRSGCFCAQPYVQRILNVSEEEAEHYRKNKDGRPGMVRVSLGFYNTRNDIDRLICALNEIIQNKDKYLKKYLNSNFSYF
ncbi:aminotransferase class V-fold PLP-dependent enzyme [Hathewaya limosa]|uniref:Selenocysteine lyase/cysteine desulfurase n=1 Tax=Hathewaya limosa TaxID=1536 RepID=A0ABU0JQN8_HATLI|nr:aminotransferase class V-fold PLP-dependent enzyme [Hathewaya limosa]MDQ0479383.1 selenocysteine lyase/cysteine desulfurase [Hathewaya limosa]